MLAWVPGVVLALWAIVRLLGLERGHPLVAMMAFTPHVAATAVLVVLALAVLRRRGPLALALAATLALAAVVLPRGLGEGARGDGPGVTVMTANVLVGATPASALMAIVREHDVDLLSVQELTPALDAAIRADGTLPHAVARPRPDGSGTGIYARLPLREIAAPRDTLHEAVAVRAAGVELYAVHPLPPLGDQAGQWRRELRNLPPARPRRIIAGDLNATLDHAELRRVLDSGYRDAAAATGDGLRGTWSYRRRLRPRITIDHVLAGPGLEPRTTAIVPLPRSDHRAVVAEMAVR